MSETGNTRAQVLITCMLQDVEDEKRLLGCSSIQFILLPEHTHTGEWVIIME